MVGDLPAGAAVTRRGSCRFPRPVEWLTTAGTVREVWLAARLQGVGGSDVDAILGRSPFRSPWDVWAVKTGRVAGEPAGERAMWGHVLEDAVARRWAVLHGARVRRAGMVADPVHPHRLASLDRVVLKEGTSRAVALLEIKTTSDRSGRLDDEELVDRYSTQVQWYLGITGLDRAHLAVLVGGQELREFTIPADPAHYHSLGVLVDRWWDRHVVADVPPEPVPQDSASMNRLPAVAGAEVVADQHALGWLNSIADLDLGIKGLEADKQEYEALLKSHMGAATELVAPDGTPLATWREQRKTGFTTKQLRAEHPDIYETYVTRGTTRVLRLKKPEGDNQ